eukprot:COSAG01_NODE_5272_length_4367_cov_52.125117_5_plen_280_part_00
MGEPKRSPHSTAKLTPLAQLTELSTHLTKKRPAFAQAQYTQDDLWYPAEVEQLIRVDHPTQPICDDGDYGGGGGGSSSKAGGIDSGVLLVDVTYVMYGNCEMLPPHRVRSHDRAPEPALCTDCVQFPTGPPEPHDHGCLVTHDDTHSPPWRATCEEGQQQEEERQMLGGQELTIACGPRIGYRGGGRTDADHGDSSSSSSSSSHAAAQAVVGVPPLSVSRIDYHHLYPELTITDDGVLGCHAQAASAGCHASRAATAVPNVLDACEQVLYYRPPVHPWY